ARLAGRCCILQDISREGQASTSTTRRLMTPERYARVCELFDAACDLTAEERTALLARACAQDPGLRADVEKMLAQDRAARAESFLTSLSLPPVPTLPVAGTDGELAPGQRLGPYAIEAKVASGGMGSVYRAVRVVDYDQVVAVKVIRGGGHSAE